jgi:putative NADPH-quinone reductase
VAHPQRIFTPAEAARAVKALQKAGVCVSRVKFTADGFEIVAGQPEEQNDSSWFKDSPLYRSKAA